MRMFLGLGCIALLCACESPAASTTLNVRVSEIGPRDVSKGQLMAMVQISGSCSQGPCDPNPCTEDARTRCLAQGTVFRCDCPAGTSLNAEGECMPDTGCTPGYCGGNGLCESVEGVPACACSLGYTGSNCEQCDNAAGFFSDGFGACTDVFDVCRAGQGIEAWNQMMAEAEEKLGHPASEIELVKATLKTVEGAVSGARSWPYLWTDEVQLVFEPADEPYIEAGLAKIPAQAEGLRPLEFEVSIERPTFTRQAKFFSGDFSVGLLGDSERKGSEPFTLDTEIVLEFEVY